MSLGDVYPSCETSNAQTHTEIGSLPKAGHCPLDSCFESTQIKTRTERVYYTVNGNPGTSVPGGRQGNGPCGARTRNRPVMSWGL